MSALASSQGLEVEPFGSVNCFEPVGQWGRDTSVRSRGSCKSRWLGAGDMAQGLRTLPALVEDLDSVPNTHIWRLIITGCDSHSGAPTPSSSPFWLLFIHGVHKFTQAHTHTYEVINRISMVALRVKMLPPSLLSLTTWVWSLESTCRRKETVSASCPPPSSSVINLK